MPPPLTISFSASVIRWRGAAMIDASTIPDRLGDRFCPPIAR